MGEVRVGVNEIKTVWSPLPFIPSHRGEGRLFRVQTKTEIADAIEAMTI